MHVCPFELFMTATCSTSVKADQMIHTWQSRDLKLISPNNNGMMANVLPPPQQLVISITNRLYFSLPLLI